MAAAQIFYSYFVALMHPYRYHDFLAHSIAFESDLPLRKLSVYESLSVSWLLVILRAFVRLIFINWIVYFILNVALEEFSFLSSLVEGGSFNFYYIVIFSAIIDVIFFPLVTYLVIEFWELLIRTAALMKNYQGDRFQAAEDVMSVSLASHIFSPIPIFGDIAQKISSMILIYVGLRARFGFNRLICLLVIFFPAFMFFFIMMLIILFVFMNFS